MDDGGEAPSQRRRRPTLGQIVTDGVGDIGHFLRLLPDIAHHLSKIVEYTRSMDREVTGMHAAVVRLEGEVHQLRAEISELDERMGTVAAAVVRLEPHIADVNLAVRPLRRARSMLSGRQAGAQGASAGATLPAPEAPAAE